MHFFLSILLRFDRLYHKMKEMLDEEQDEDISPEAARKVMGLSKSDIGDEKLLVLIELINRLIYNEDLLVDAQNRTDYFS